MVKIKANTVQFAVTSGDEAQSFANKYSHQELPSKVNYLPQSDKESKQVKQDAVTKPPPKKLTYSASRTENGSVGPKDFQRTPIIKRKNITPSKTEQAPYIMCGKPLGKPIPSWVNESVASTYDLVIPRLMDETAEDITRTNDNKPEQPTLDLLQTICRSIKLMQKTTNVRQHASLLAVVAQLLKNEVKYSYNNRRCPTPLSVSRWQSSKVDTLSSLVKQLQSKGWRGFEDHFKEIPDHVKDYYFVPLNIRTQELLDRLENQLDHGSDKQRLVCEIRKELHSIVQPVKEFSNIRSFPITCVRKLGKVKRKSTRHNSMLEDKLIPDKTALQLLHHYWQFWNTTNRLNSVADLELKSTSKGY